MNPCKNEAGPEAGKNREHPNPTHSPPGCQGERTRELLEAALFYSAKGWPVFPCKPRGKEPLTPNGFKDATTDAEQIRAWWARWPDANIGIPTGAVSGNIVLDMDPRAGGDKTLAALVAKHGPLPPTRESITGGGGGHISLRHPGGVVRCGAGKLGPGLDVKGDGGYIVVPPSVHPTGRRYEWKAGCGPEEVALAECPPWLLDLLTRERPRSAKPAAEGPIPEGRRNDTLTSIAGSLRRKGVEEPGILAALLGVNREQCSPPLPEEEVARIAASVARYPAGAAEDTDSWRSWKAPDDSYWVRDGEFFRFKGYDKDGNPILARLSNFAARVVEEVAEDDGAEASRFFVIEGRLHDGRRLPPARVPVGRFPGLTWVQEAWGFGPSIAAGQGARDHLRAAIEAYSEDLAGQDGVPLSTTYKHTGWREIGGRWVYLHGGGAIGPDGPERGVAVSLDVTLAGYVLPDPPEGEALRAAIRASLGMVGVAPKAVTVPVYGAIWRAVLGGADCSLHLAGPTGAGKTELAALAQQHYCPGMDARHLPANWISTGNALEAVAFVAKDALLTVDDFAPSGSSADVARLHREADRLMRAQGNRSGRRRMNPDGTLKEEKPPRGLILSTGEDVPRGQSLRARFLNVEMTCKDMNWAKLTKCQQDAKAGLYAQAMAGFVRWLAPRYGEVQARLWVERDECAATLTRNEMHRRTPRVAADLAVGLRCFLDFALEAGAITAPERESLWREWWAALLEAAEAQERHQEAADPARRFMELIGAAITSGAAHLATLDGGEPTDPGSWGWRLVVVGTGDHERHEWRPQGERIGWVDGDNVYLLPDSAYAAAQGLARRQGETLPVSARTLWKRLHERGLLVTTGKGAKGRDTHCVRRTCEGHRREVLHVQADLGGCPTPKKTDQSDHTSVNPCGSTASAGQAWSGDLRLPDHWKSLGDKPFWAIGQIGQFFSSRDPLCVAEHNPIPGDADAPPKNKEETQWQTDL